MGDNYLQEQCKNLRKRRDALVKKGWPTLLTRPEMISTVFVGTLDPKCDARQGSRLRVELNSDKKVVLVDGNQIVGCIEGEGRDVLADALADEAVAGIAEVCVKEVSPISGCVRLTLSEKDNEKRESR